MSERIYRPLLLTIDDRRPIKGVMRMKYVVIYDADNKARRKLGPYSDDAAASEAARWQGVADRQGWRMKMKVEEVAKPA
jgi:hypothetical protein